MRKERDLQMLKKMKMKIQMRKWNYNTNTGISITSIVIIIIITNPQRYKKENNIPKSHNEMKTNFF